MKVAMEMKTMSPEDLRQFLNSSEAVSFEGMDRKEVYQWTEETLRGYRYREQGKQVRGLVRQLLAKMTGLSQPQTTRLVSQYLETGKVVLAEYQRRKFPRTYTPGDTRLLVKVDQAHGCLSGPATVHILKREFEEFGKQEFERLADISVSHLYNLRSSQSYKRRCTVIGHTKPAKAIPIGERRKPEPGGRPGYIRVDTVHQPERDGVKSVYHINAVDEVTQWEVLGCTAKISEHHLVPVVAAMLEQFPFPVRGFHSDNGAEFVNHTVGELLEKLRIEFTRSRPRRSNDNALAETKNGAVVRKNMGYQWLPPSLASDIDLFYRTWFNPYLNYHRPCWFATITTDAKGKDRKLYETYQTPFECLQSLPSDKRRLKAGMTIGTLDKVARGSSDTDFALLMQAARQELFQRCDQHAIGHPIPVVRELGGRQS